MTFERTGPESDEPHRALIRFFSRHPSPPMYDKARPPERHGRMTRGPSPPKIKGKHK